MMDSHSLKRHVSDFYSEKILAHGTTAKGVDWNSTESQWLRFEQLINGFDLQNPDASLNDLGCGYGELLKCLEIHHFKGVYRGYDLTQEMIQAAQEQFNSAQYSKSEFILGDELALADYTVASGTFNVRQAIPNEQWEQYIRDCLLKMKEASRKAFSFNLLTLYSDPPLRKDYLYYGDPLVWFDYCKRHFSRNVALLHDYNLYEFTIRVRLDS
jgi:SAM-dependent methyltransferase